jgi:uncharacterized protein (DUF488 family)
VGGIATIGVYGWDADEFLGALTGAAVGVVLDLRQRRGVRGSEYAWANSVRLQAALAETGIEYRHLKELAPTTAMREAQYAEDDRRGEGKRSRSKISAAFAAAYEAEVLARADLAPVAEVATRTLPALLCVERDPEACHRSLVAARLERDHGLAAVHFRPGPQEG